MLFPIWVFIFFPFKYLPVNRVYWLVAHILLKKWSAMHNGCAYIMLYAQKLIDVCAYNFHKINHRENNHIIFP